MRSILLVLILLVSTAYAGVKPLQGFTGEFKSDPSYAQEFADILLQSMPQATGIEIDSYLLRGDLGELLAVLAQNLGLELAPNRFGNYIYNVAFKHSAPSDYWELTIGASEDRGGLEVNWDYRLNHLQAKYGKLSVAERQLVFLSIDELEHALDLDLPRYLKFNQMLSEQESAVLPDQQVYLYTTPKSVEQVSAYIAKSVADPSYLIIDRPGVLGNHSITFQEYDLTSYRERAISYQLITVQILENHITANVTAVSELVAGTVVVRVTIIND